MTLLKFTADLTVGKKREHHGSADHVARECRRKKVGQGGSETGLSRQHQIRHLGGAGDDMSGLCLERGGNWLAA